MEEWAGSFRRHSITERTDTPQRLRQYQGFLSIFIYIAHLKASLGETVFMSDTGLYHDPLRHAWYVMHSHRFDRRVILPFP